MAGFGRKVVTVTDVSELQPGYVLESFNIASCGDLKKVASINTSEFVGLVDTNISLLPEKTGLSYNVHPTYIMNPHDIVHIGYASVEYKTIMDLYFRVREHVKIFDIDFTGEVLQKFIQDSQEYKIPKQEVFRSSASRGPRFENPPHIFGRPSGIVLDDSRNLATSGGIPDITDTLKSMINFKSKGIMFDEIGTLEILLTQLIGIGRILNENDSRRLQMQQPSSQRMFNAVYKDFLSTIPSDAVRDMSSPNVVSLESTFDGDLGLYDHLAVAEDEPVTNLPGSDPVLLVYTFEGYCVGVIDDRGRLFNRGGFYVTTVKTNEK